MILGTLSVSIRKTRSTSDYEDNDKSIEKPLKAEGVSEIPSRQLLNK